jgi:tellurite resistance protein
MRDLTRGALRRSCNEEAPSELHEALNVMFNQANFGGFKNEVITEFSMHEVTIEIDEFGNIEHREIRVEGRTEYRNDEEQ